MQTGVHQFYSQISFSGSIYITKLLFQDTIFIIIVCLNLQMKRHAEDCGFFEKLELVGYLTDSNRIKY